jgi:hypothetical protein
LLGHDFSECFQWHLESVALARGRFVRQG